MKKLIILSLLTLVFGFFSNAQTRWISFNGKSESEPIVTIEKGNNALSLILEIEIPGVRVQDLEHNGQQFQRFEMISNQTTKETGLPELPMLHRLIGLPGNTLAGYTILEESVTTLDNIVVYPFQEPGKDGRAEKTPEFKMNKAFYASAGSFPSDRITLDKPSVWRDARVSGIHITPCVYHPADKKLTVNTRLRIRVDLNPTPGIEPLNRSKAISPSFYNMYKKALVNFDMLGFTQLLSSADTTVKYLIITNTAAVSAIQPFVNWKNEQGFKVEVKTIGPGFSTPQHFFNYIQQLYNSDNLEYVLMVGDAYPNGGTAGGSNIVPMYWWAPSGEDPTYSDSWYTCLSGPDDHYADLAIGRFTYDNLTELQLQIEKTIGHYRTPDTTTNWAQNSLLVAHEEQYPQKYTLCKEEIRTYSYPLQSLNFQTCYGGAGANNTDIINYVNNNSCGIFNYRGHGSATEFWEWGASGSFTATHVAQLTNEDRLFVLFDVCCDNMDIVSHPGNCLCEDFMKSPVASVAINGAIIPSYTIPNHDYDKEMYKAVLEEGIYNIGYVTNFANITVLNVHGTIGRSNVRTYLWLGDASLEPWTKQPVSLSVTHDSQLFLGMSSMQVQVMGLTGPEENARVCISNAAGTIYGVAFTDASGMATVQFPGPVQDPGSAKVTATQHNYLPYQGIIQVIPQSGPYVVKDAVVVHDPAGNNNGLLDYNETANLTVSMKNVGVTTATNVMVSLHSSSPYVTLTDSTELFGNINPGIINNMNDAFALSIAPNVPNNTTLAFVLEATDGTNVWTSNFTLKAGAPLLGLQSFTISDPAGNGNGKLDPGETATFMVNLQNTGLSDAFNVNAMLTSTDPLITINTGSQVFGNMIGSGTASMSYSVTASIATPPGYQADFNLDISADFGINGTGAFQTIIGQIPILIVDLDGNHNSAPAMNAAIQALGLTADVQTSFPADLNLYSSIFVCLGIYSDNHVLSSAEGQNLADYLNAGGRLYMEGGDTWAYDAQTAVHPMFKIDGSEDGGSDLVTISGLGSAFTNGMSFNYTGDENYIDRLVPLFPGFNIFQNSSPSYTCGIAHDAGTYKTIGCSFEFSGLSDAVNPSTKQELMHQYLLFFGLISESLSSNFSANNTTLCQNTNVTFTDISNGNPISWEWSFPGGTPSTSTLQNPTVNYSTAGSYDVILIVSDGTNYDTTIKVNYITVVESLPAATMPAGPASLCQGISYTTLNIPAIPGALSYQWTLTPAGCGTITGTGSITTIYWNVNWFGTASVTVKGVNSCGVGLPSPPATILMNQAPGVSLAPQSAACLSWPAFSLSGGLPAGGTYSGPGVNGGMFNPSASGIGSHMVVYTYINQLGCSNSASQTLYVDACTEISEQGADGIQIFPNPNDGNFNIEISDAGTGNTEIILRNTQGQSVFSTFVTPSNGQIHTQIQLNGFADGLYLVQVINAEKVLNNKILIKK